MKRRSESVSASAFSVEILPFRTWLDGFEGVRMTIQTPSHLSLCSPGGGSSVRDTTPVLGVQVETRVPYRLTEVGQRVFLSNRWESIGGTSCSRMQRFQKMLCIQTRCHKLRSFIDHHRENLFTALVNYRDLIEVDNAVSR